MSNRACIVSILAIAFVVAALTSVFIVAVTTNDSSSTTTTTNQESFENVSDVKKKSEKSAEEYSTGGLTDALHFADGVIISLDRDLETAEVKIATPGYGLNSGSVYAFGFSERIENHIVRRSKHRRRSPCRVHVLSQQGRNAARRVHRERIRRNQAVCPKRDDERMIAQAHHSLPRNRKARALMARPAH